MRLLRKSSVTSLLFRNKTDKSESVETRTLLSPNSLTASHEVTRKTSLQDDALLKSVGTPSKNDTESNPSEMESVTKNDDVLNSIHTSATENSSSVHNNIPNDSSVVTEEKTEPISHIDTEDSTINSRASNPKTPDMEQEVIMR